MALKVFLATFTAVFLAELADKTQFVGLGMTAKTGRPFMVWLGSVSAYIIVTGLTVLVGAMIGKYIKPELIRYAGGVIFIVIGLLICLGKV